MQPVNKKIDLINTEKEVKRGLAVNDEAIKLVWRMVLNCMAGQRGEMWQIYEQYIRQRRLYVTIGEILEYKRRRSA